MVSHRAQSTLELAEPLHQELIGEVKKQSVYIDKGLFNLDVGARGTQVHLTLDGRREAEIVARTQRFLDAIRRGFRPTETQTVARNERSSTRPYECDVFAKLVQRGWVLDLGQGQVALAGPALALANALDRSIVQVAIERFGAGERSLTFWREQDNNGHAHDAFGTAWGCRGDTDVLKLDTDGGLVDSREYPNPFERIAGALDARHSGDVWITVRPGCEFAVRGSPPHVGGGSHGALHALDSLSPVIAAGGRRLPRAMRSVDLAAWCLEACGVTAPKEIGAARR
jgi:hypothetical protein